MIRLFDALRSFVCRRPGLVAAAWIALALGVGLGAPDLTRLASEGQSRLISPGAESVRAGHVVARAWPDQSYTALAVAVLHRATGLTDADRAYVARLAERFQADDHPHTILRVLGPGSPAEIAGRLVSADGTVQLIALPLGTEFVRPQTRAAVTWLRARADEPALGRPDGLEVRWTGDAVIGGDYMAAVETSLDRAAIATVVLLLVVLLAVYRSFVLALVPLATIGISLVLSRAALAWLFLAGWEVSPLVELFLVAVLFGSGTDFCLFVSRRFAEHFDPDDPAGAMAETLRRGARALLTSAGTVVVGLLLMGTTRFKLFSMTGPSVALGLLISLAATLTLTPALLVLLARHRPRVFAGLTEPASGFWFRVGRVALARPLLSWAAGLLLVAPLAILGLRTTVVQDLMTELPGSTDSTRAFRLMAEKFDAGRLTPLSVVLESNDDLRGSEGLALIDDLSRHLARQHEFTEVRSATRPLGSPEPLSRARIASRLGEVNDGFGRIAEGAATLKDALARGAAKVRAAVWLEGATGLKVGGPSADKPAKEADARLKLIHDLTEAAGGAGQIADGAARARREVGAILDDPVGRRALDRLLVNAETVRDHPEIRRSFRAYLTADGRRARIDLAQADRVFSPGAMDGVEALRRRVRTFLEGASGPSVRASVAGANAESADIRAMTRSDQRQSWVVIPLGVFLVLLAALRDPLACANLVATMLLTYAFALGATHLVFVDFLGAEGLDWKVPYFLFVLLVAVGVDYNVFLMARLHEESETWGLKAGIVRAVGLTGGLISSAAAITACSFASFLTSPLGSLRQLGFALVVGIAVDALVVRPLLVPCGHWLAAGLRSRRSTAPHLPTRHALPAPGRPAGAVASKTRRDFF